MSLLFVHSTPTYKYIGQQMEYFLIFAINTARNRMSVLAWFSDTHTNISRYYTTVNKYTF